MKVKRFFESIESDKWLIDAFFSDFSDGTLDSKNFKFELDEKNENFFEVIISCTKPKNSIDIMDKVQNIIDLNKIESELLLYIKSSLIALEDSSEFEKVTFDSYSRGSFNIRIWTKVKGDVENWFTITEDGYFEMDELRLKVLMKEKFDIEVSGVSEKEDIDRYGEPYREIVIQTGQNLSDDRNKAFDVLNYFRTIRRNYWQMERRVFTNVTFNRNRIELDLDSSIQFG
jgi:hypothetical protein